MSMINAVIRQHRATQVFFDCRDAAPDPADQRKIEQGRGNLLRKLGTVNLAEKLRFVEES